MGTEGTHLKGRRVALKVLLSMSGNSTAYGPPSASSSSRNWVSGGICEAFEPHSGVIHHSLHRAHARNRLQFSCVNNEQCVWRLLSSRSFTRCDLPKELPIVANAKQYTRTFL